MAKKQQKITISLATFSESDYNINNIKYIIDTVIDNTVKNAYYVLCAHAAFKAYKGRGNLKNKLVEPETLQDYKNNLVATHEYSKSLDVGFDFASKLKIKKLKETSEIRDEFLEILKECIAFVNGAIKLKDIEVNGSTREYIKNVNMLSSSMKGNILSMARMSDHPSVTNAKFGDGYKNIFEDLAEYFSANVELAKMIMDHERTIRKETEKLKKEMAMIDAKSKAVHFEPNEKEQARLRAIKKANDKYEEFCLDFMRDLEKQVPLSTRDMYETFINEKFAKFQNRFNMPLANSASEGLATEAMYQIDLMIDYISKIKENSYVTSVYKE